MKISEKAASESARMYARRMILDNIMNLELPPGSALSEHELSLALNLSRTPVREALIEMGRLDLVEIIPKKGSFVTKIDYELIEEAKFMRLSLENSVLRLACEEGISDNALERIRENVEEQRKYIDISYEQNNVSAAMLELDNTFHKLLFESVNKARIYEVLHAQMVHFDRLRILAYKVLKAEKNNVVINAHENILYALEKQDYELAEMVMTSHLTRHQVEKDEIAGICPDYFI